MDWNLKTLDMKELMPYTEFYNNNLDGYNQLMTTEELAKIARLLRKDILDKINAYRESKGLEEVSSSKILQEATLLRAKETIHDPSHTRKDSENGMDAPYELGYPKNHVTQGEMIEHLKSNSLKWIIHHGTDKVLESFLNSDASFIITSDIIDQGIGVYIEEDAENYFASFIYLNAKLDENEEIPEAPEAPLLAPSENLVEEMTTVEVDKSGLVELYNKDIDMNRIDFTSPLFSDYMIKKAEVKEVYQNPNATQEEVTQIFEELNAIIEELS